MVVGLGLQMAVTPLVAAVLVSIIAFRAAGAEEALVSWVVFVSVLIGGLTGILQAFRFGRIGAGFILASSASAAGIAVTTDALRSGGPALLATLVLCAALLQNVNLYNYHSVWSLEHKAFQRLTPLRMALATDARERLCFASSR